MAEGKQDNKKVEKDEISLKDVILKTGIWYRYLWARRKLIILISIIGAALGLTYSFIFPPTYVANTSLVLESTKKSGLGEYASIAARFGFSTSSGGGLFQEDNNIISFMKSRTMISKTLYSKDHFDGKDELLAERYYQFNDYPSKWKNNARLSGLKFHEDPQQRSILEDSVISFYHKEILRKNLFVGKPDVEEDIIVVSTNTRDELFSKAFNEHLLENITGFYIETQTKRSLENVRILEHQVDSIRQLLNIALSGVASTTEANPNPNPAFQRLKVPSQKRMVDVEMNKAILEELVKNLEISKISLRKETPLVQVIDKPVLPLEKQKTGKIKGTVVGGMTAFFLICLFLSLQLVVRTILQD